MQAVLALLDSPQVAVRTFTAEWSGRELRARAGGAARFLDSYGVPPRPTPALLASTAEAVALTLGGALTGRPIAPLGVRLAVPELVPLVRRLDAPVLVADTANAALGAEVAEAAHVTLAVVDDDVERADLDVVPTTSESVVVVLHTSGTTGTPKTVPVRDEAVRHRAGAYHRFLGLDTGELYCGAGAFHHTGGIGMYFVALACGAGVLPLPRFSTEMWRAAADLRPTCALLVPTMIDLLLAERALDSVPLRALHYGTAPIHPTTLTEALEALPTTRFAQAYGQTEGGPLTMLEHEEHLRALHGEPHLLASVGRPCPGVDVRIEGASEDGVGEVVARAGQVFLPGPDGWLHTGDLGRVDAEGYVYLRGRLGEMIIRGGENVYPLEVERVLETHRQVREAAVVGVDDRRWGQTIKAYVVAADTDDPPDAASLSAYCRERLAPFKIPVDWELRAELPRNAAGKLLRRSLPG
jgi:acyl-CoA synthetase (AMP-forming)/AMP-acid ligase II